MAGLMGVDIGGSGVRTATLSAGGVRPSEVQRRSLTDRSVDHVIGAVIELLQSARPDAVGVAVPGFVRGGRVLASPNFPQWRDVALQQRLEGALGVPVAVENDANAAALGAWRVRGGVEDLVLLTLGTGTGGGVVLGGELVRGTGTGGELGHLYAGGDRPCGCGGRGCLETWASTVGLLAAAREHGHQVEDGESVVLAADRGEGWAVAILERAGEALGRGLVTLVNIFAPEVVLIAGGLAGAERYLWPPAERVLGRAIPPSRDHASVHFVGRAEVWSIAGAAEQAGRLAAARRAR